MASSIFPLKTYRYKNGDYFEEDDLVVVEEPLEIRIGFGALDNREEKSLVITMRTPGNDFELAAGFLYCEGIIDSENQIISIKYCYTSGKEQEEDNVVRVELHPSLEVDLSKSERHGFSHSGCGICGLTSIDSAFKLASLKIHKDDLKIKLDLISSLPEKSHEHQHNYKHTGGIHSASLFSLDGRFIDIMEDVGRHNAVDKLIGKRLRSKESNSNSPILFLSGRMGFELVQKAAMAGIPILISVGAPSSLAIQLGMKMKMTLVGFTRNNTFNVYSGAERIQV
jgi:FdhD protein